MAFWNPSLMKLEQTVSWQPPKAQLKMIGFDTMTSDDIIESSIFDSHENVRGIKSLCDNRLGLPNSDCICATCKVSTMRDEHQCPGHFGHLSLSVPIFNPLHIQVLVRVLNKICPSCGKLKPGKQKKVREGLQGWIVPEASHQCQSTTTEEINCKYCAVRLKKDSDMAYPDIKFKLVKKRSGTATFGEVDVDAIEMHIESHKTTLAPDCWSFIDRSIDVPENPRLTRPLLPAEAIKVLENASTEEIAKMSWVLRPDTLIMKDFVIPPNCLRFVETSKGGTTSRKLERGSKTQMLANVLSVNNSIKAMYNDLYVAERDALDLQAKVLNYFKSFKIFSSEKEQAAFQHNNREIKRSRKSVQRVGPTWFKKNILGKRTHYSAIAVVTGDPNLGLQQLAVPQIVAKKLKVPVAVTRYNLDKLKNDLSKSTDQISIVRDKKRHGITGPNRSDLQIGDVVERPLVDGDLIFANRSPSIHMHSFIGFEVKIERRHSFGINPMLCSPFSADFDGDILHMYVPQCLAARTEVAEMLKVSHQMKSPQGGQALLGLSEDGLLSSYLILQQCFWLDKYQMQMLNMYCASFVPMPAIVKSPGGGPLWTGLQAISMTLPSHINSKDFVIQNSEILECPAEKKRLMKSPNGIVQLVLDQAGPEETALFLIRIQTVLHEWLSLIGFSVGIKDLLLAKDFKSRRRLMEEVETALEEARDSSCRAVKLFNLHNHMDTSRDDENNQEGSIASGNNDDVGIEAFQTVFQDIHTAVERHSLNSNAILAMVKSGSKGSLHKLVQQSVCLGLQLLDGKRWLSGKEPMEGFWEYPGIIESSFLDGLKYEEFMNHVISKRSLPKGYGVEGAGELFRSCMFGMRELYAAYDGSVRTRCGNHIVQFCYDNDSEGGEAVGALAVTAVIEPAYNYTFEQSVSTTVNPITLLKETLSRGTHTKVKHVDLKSILRISTNAVRKKSDWERVALRIQHYLQCVTLGNLPFTAMIEHNFEGANSISISPKQSPWLIHIHIAKETLRKRSLRLEDILSVLSARFSAQNTGNFHCSEHCDYGSSKKSYPCILVHYESVEEMEINNFGYEHPNFLKYFVIPSLSKAVLRGSQQVKAATVQWEDFNNVLCNTGGIPKQPIAAASYKDNNQMGELAVEVFSEALSEEGTWGMVRESCFGIMELIDWRRSGPYSIPEVCNMIGIEAARRLIYERLKISVQSMGGKVHAGHLSLIADYMTHSGKVLALTAAGMRLWNKEMGISAPFTEGAFSDPKRIFLDAARKQKTEELCGLLSSIVWGKTDGMRENDLFELMWCQLNDTEAPVQDQAQTMGNTKELEKNAEQVKNLERTIDQQVAEGNDKLMNNIKPSEGNIGHVFEEDDNLLNNEERREKTNMVPEHSKNTEQVIREQYTVIWKNKNLETNIDQQVTEGNDKITNNIKPSEGNLGHVSEEDENLIKNEERHEKINMVPEHSKNIEQVIREKNTVIWNNKNLETNIDQQVREGNDKIMSNIEPFEENIGDVFEEDENLIKNEEKFVKTNMVPKVGKKDVVIWNISLENNIAQEVTERNNKVLSNIEPFEENIGRVFEEDDNLVKDEERLEKRDMASELSKNIEQSTKERNTVVWNNESLEKNIEQQVAEGREKITSNVEENIGHVIDEDDNLINNKERLEKTNIVPELSNYTEQVTRENAVIWNDKSLENQQATEGNDKMMSNIQPIEENIGHAIEEDDYLIKNEETLAIMNMSPVIEESGMYSPRFMYYSDEICMDMEYPPGFPKPDDVDDSMDDELPPGFEHCERMNAEQLSERPSDPKDLTMEELTASVQNILHCRYHDGQQLEKNDMEFIIQRVLIHHPEVEQKVGGGIKAIKIGRSSKFPDSRCFVLIRKDGSSADFSFRKCLQNIRS